MEFQKVPFVLEFCKRKCDTVLENNKIHQFFSILLDLCDARKKTVKIAGFVEELGGMVLRFSLPVVPVFINTIMKIFW